MFAVDLPHYLRRLAEWRKADPAQRVVRTTRDARGRRCREYLSYGVVRCRIVDVGGGMCELYADRGMRFKAPEQSRISFTEWGQTLPKGRPTVEPSERWVPRY